MHLRSRLDRLDRAAAVGRCWTCGVGPLEYAVRFEDEESDVPGSRPDCGRMLVRRLRFDDARACDGSR